MYASRACVSVSTHGKATYAECAPRNSRLLGVGQSTACLFAASSVSSRPVGRAQNIFCLHNGENGDCADIAGDELAVGALERAFGVSHGAPGWAPQELQDAVTYGDNIRSLSISHFPGPKQRHAR